jgi:hypothetical protein
VTDSFWPILVGCVINQASVAILLNGIALIATVWFAAEERNKATALASFSFVIGALVCLAITVGCSATYATSNTA